MNKTRLVIRATFYNELGDEIIKISETVFTPICLYQGKSRDEVIAYEIMKRCKEVQRRLTKAVTTTLTLKDLRRFFW